MNIEEPEIHQDLIGVFKRDVVTLEDKYGYVVFERRGGLMSPVDVLRAHYFVADYFYENDEEAVFLVGIKSPDLFMSAIDRAFVGYNGKYKWNNIYEKISTVYYGMIKNHPFHDANKRTAFLFATSALYEKKIVITDDYINKFEDLAVDIAEGNLEKYKSYKNKYMKENDGEILFISKWIKRRCRSIDKRYYAITYRALATRLRRFGFDLCHPRKNYIHVCDNNGSRLCEIGFPSWGAQVGKKAINTVLEKTQLKAKYGYDAAAFFKGNEPYAYMINKYKKNFERLKHR